MIDVDRLRVEVAQRAHDRPKMAFDGRVDDERLGGRLVRRYQPGRVEAGRPWVVFLHGGYGLFGDLELQDSYCRLLADVLPARVVAIDYRLAPEHTISDAIADVARVTEALRNEGGGPIVLCGDSAGGALALATALESSGDGAGLLLTNPNVDLTLSSYDRSRPCGPDLEISTYAFRAWTGVADLAQAPRFQDRAADLPPVFIAVGDEDSLMPECEALITARTQAGEPAELLTLAGVGHGLMGDWARARRIIKAMAGFVDSWLRPSRRATRSPDADEDQA